MGLLRDKAIWGPVWGRHMRGRVWPYERGVYRRRPYGRGSILMTKRFVCTHA